jgi:hypothetical protein
VTPKELVNTLTQDQIYQIVTAQVETWSISEMIEYIAEDRAEWYAKDTEALADMLEIYTDDGHLTLEAIESELEITLEDAS